MLVRELLGRWGNDLSTDDHPVTSHLVYVGFDALDDEEERQYLKWLPTSFVLKDSEVDRLREAGSRLLRDSRDSLRGAIRMLRAEGDLPAA